jgi:hypothetical protein
VPNVRLQDQDNTQLAAKRQSYARQSDRNAKAAALERETPEHHDARLASNLASHQRHTANLSPPDAHAQQVANARSHGITRSKQAASKATLQRETLAASAARGDRGKPPLDLLRLYEKDVLASRLHFADACGFDALDLHFGSGVPNLLPVTAEQKSERLAAFNKAMAPDTPIVACAACGISRMVVESELFASYSLDDVEAVRLSKQVRFDSVVFLVLLKNFAFSLPRNQSLTMSTLFVWCLLFLLILSLEICTTYTLTWLPPPLMVLYLFLCVITVGNPSSMNTVTHVMVLAMVMTLDSLVLFLL